jgi:NAD(P)-dependent dehydrogenase (short-subunit alcohol dehydrogenase family)
MGIGSQRLAGKVAMITGGNQGIGKAIARRFVQEGARVMVIARSLDKLAQTKAEIGVEMMTRVAAMEMGPLIRACSVIPGLIATERAQGVMAAPSILNEFLENILVDRAGTPDDVANAVLFLASDEASFITGHHLYVDGGQFNKRYPYKAFEQTRHDTFAG